MSNQLIKNKLIDPFIFSLIEKISEKRALLDELQIIDINPQFSDIFSNKKGCEFFIENELHKARGFRRLHVEVAEFSGNLKILHCVFFPDPLFNIPIFGMDLIKINNIVTAAIVDLSPVTNPELPEIANQLDKVNKDGFSKKREIPDWGDIFSRNVFFASLRNKEEQQSFYNIVDRYLSILVNYSKSILPDDCSVKINARKNYQKKYCKQQMKNEKTSIVLLKYFEKNWVDKYINEILFDF